MKVLLLHNHYRLPGGEDGVFRAEAAMLRSHGIDVMVHQTDNGSENGGLKDAAEIVWRSAWSQKSHDEIRRICDRFQPDVAHTHNFWMKLSPSVHAACHASGVATVQTLHNFRLFCANALFLRNGKVCQDCLGKLPWRGVVRKCYRQSVFASAASAAMITVNRRRETWNRDVDAYIALTEHSRAQFIAGELPAERIFVKPNFIPDPGEPVSTPSKSDLILYAGRLATEKGVDILLSAWARNKLSRFGRLQVVGEGDRRRSLEQQASSLGLEPPQVVFAGARTAAEIPAIIAQARAMVLPSLYFECFPLNVLEAFANGRPLVASDHGALKELVRDGEVGLTAPPGDVAGLGDALQRLLRDDDLADRLGRQARVEYLTRYTEQENFKRLMQIYDFAKGRRSPVERTGPGGHWSTVQSIANTNVVSGDPVTHVPDWSARSPVIRSLPKEA